MIICIALLFIGSCSDCNNLSTPPVVKNAPGNIIIDQQESGNPAKNKGISNNDNLCYMNAVVEILTSLYSKAFEKKSDQLAEAANRLINAITGKEEVSQATIDQRAKKFFNSIKTYLESKDSKGWKPENGKQEDASELLVKILDWLGLSEPQYLANICYKFINLQTKEERLNSPTNPWASVWPVSMPSDENHLATMQDFFNNSLASEILEDYEWETGFKVPARKITFLKDLNKLYGKMLVIHLKRFEYEESGAKINKLIDKPFELVIKKEQTIDLSQDLPYQLAGFIQHTGKTIEFGHYVAYTKVDEHWIKYDDNTVSEVSNADAEAAAKGAYLFFYKPAKPI